MKRIEKLFYYLRTFFLKTFWLGKNVSIRSVFKSGFYFERLDKRSYLSIARGFYCRPNCSIINKGKLIIGENVFFNRNVSITCLDNITIGKNVSIGNNVVIVDHDHDKNKRGEFVCSRIVIGENVWIGANSVILRGSKIGDNAIIGANSVVKGDVPENSVFFNKRNEVCDFK